MEGRGGEGKGKQDFPISLCGVVIQHQSTSSIAASATRLAAWKVPSAVATSGFETLARCTSQPSRAN